MQTLIKIYKLACKNTQKLISECLFDKKEKYLTFSRKTGEKIAKYEVISIKIKAIKRIPNTRKKITILGNSHDNQCYLVYYDLAKNEAKIYKLEIDPLEHLEKLLSSLICFNQNF